MKKILNWIKSLFSRVYSIFYVGSTDMLPEPLSKEMEEYYVEKMQRGDLAAKDKLIEHNLRLVAHIVKKFERFENNTDDLISIGTIGLIKGIDSFKPDKKYGCGTRIRT